MMETLRYVVLANGLLAVVSVAYYVLLRRETFFGANRLVLWLGLAGTLLLPLLDLPDWRPQPVRSVMQQTAKAIVPRILPKPDYSSDVTITFPNQRTYQAFQAQQPQVNWSWQLGLLLVYIAGLSFLLIRFCVQLFSLRKLIRQSVHEPYDDFIVVSNKTVTSPFSFFHWVVLNPSQHTSDELEQILRHERVHVHERHSVDMLVVELVRIVFWFNPAAYLFRHLLHEILEFSADRAVLAEGIDAKAYQYNLLKVSLSAGQSTLTNHFSKAQLKSRIVMLNQPKSAKATWLKYPVLFIATLTVASTFARTQHIKALSKYMPKPVVEAIDAVTEPTEGTGQPFIEQKLLAECQPTKLRGNPLKVQTPSDIQVSLPLDSTRQLPKKDSSRVSPSRYMTYQGNYLYWIVTPKTTFDDFIVMKKEFEKQGHVMQLNEIKYDPLYTFIDRISFTVRRPTGGMSRCDETDDDTKPIPTIAGFIGIGPKLGGSGTGSLRFYKTDFPEVLRKTAAEEEASVNLFIKDHRLDYLIHVGNQKFKDLGSGESTYSKAYFKNKSIRNSGLILNTDGSLSVDQALGAIPVFINNELVERETLSTWKVEQLYSVVKKSQFNPAKKESFTSALLLYTTEGK